MIARLRSLTSRWTSFVPALAVVLLVFTWGRDLPGAVVALVTLVLAGAVLSAVYRAEVVAHRVGEQFGSLVLAVAVTIIEVALIVTLPADGGDRSSTLARDTVFAAAMITCNGIVGLCLLVASLRHRTAVFNPEGTGAALATVATYDLVHAGTTNSERTKLGPTWFHHTALGLASTTTNGVDTGFIAEPAGTLNSMTTGGKSYYYLTDATGNVLGLVDDTGKRTHTYGPTGLPRGTTTEATPSRTATPAPNLDPTGLYKMGHRYYDPSLGRFTQPDPSGQEANPYLYAAGDCINRTDPTGTISLGCIGSGLQLLGGAVALGAGIASAVGSGGLSTPASVAAIGGGIGLIDNGISTVDSCQ
jgi:RHS repeat-associated protein